MSESEVERSPVSLMVDASIRRLSGIEIDADEWREVATATMEADMWQVGGMVARVGDKVEFRSPAMAVAGIVSEVHQISTRGDLLYSLVEASVQSITIHEGDVAGKKFGPMDCAFLIKDSREFSGNVTRVNVIETIGDGPRRDSTALALERHDLDMQRDELGKREQELLAGRTREAVRASRHVDLDDHDECREFVRSLRGREPIPLNQLDV